MSCKVLWQCAQLWAYCGPFSKLQGNSIPSAALRFSIYESTAFAALILMIGVVPHHPHRANRRQRFTPLRVSRSFQFWQLLALLLSHAAGLLFPPLKLEW